MGNVILSKWAKQIWKDGTMRSTSNEQHVPASPVNVSGSQKAESEIKKTLERKKREGGIIKSSASTEERDNK